MFRFFQVNFIKKGKNVKVSIFISDGLQSDTGLIHLDMNEQAPPATKQPGEITYTSIGKTERIAHPLASIYIPCVFFCLF